MTKEERIQQIKDCGQTIIDKAADIYGNYEYPTDLEVVIKFNTNEIPSITVKRDFVSKIMLHNFCKR